MEYTTEELHEREQLTAAIAANLKAIDDDRSNFDDLEGLLATTNKIVANLRAIADDGTNADDLEELLATTNAIVLNLKTIEENQVAAE